MELTFVNRIVLVGALILLALGVIFSGNTVKITEPVGVAIPQTIKQKFENKTPRERANIKGVEIARLKNIPRTTTVFADFDIEVVSAEAIEGGARVFVKAWFPNGDPVGFGDGTVEIEKINLIMNGGWGYILVHDPQGSIEVEEFVDGISVGTRNFREDPRKALMKRLGVVVASIAKDGSNIISGKRGSTVTVVDYNATNSKQINQDDVTPYSTAHDATTGTVLTLTTNSTHNVLHHSDLPAFFIRRADLEFNTSSIDSGDTVTAVTLTLFSAGSGGGDTNAESLAILDDTNQGALSTPVVAEDYNDFPTTAIITKDLTDYTNIGSNVTSQDFGTYAVINKGGTTKIGLRTTGDTSDTEPTGANILRIGTGSVGDDPFITVTHSVPVTITNKQNVIWFD